MSEYLHDLNDDVTSFEPTPDLPELPETENEFGYSEETETAFGAEFGSSGDVSSITEETFANVENSTFDSSEFGSTEFGSNDFGSTDFNTESDSSAENDSFKESGDPEDPFSVSEDPSFTVEETESSFELTPEEIPESEVSSEVEVEETEGFSNSPFNEPEESTFKTPETFSDLKKFAESSNFTGMGAEGNPSFSVLLKNVRFIEDVTDILSLLKELKLMTDQEDQLKARLMRGHLLVPRISEYAAIFLAHKLRRFDIDIQVGLSDEIHPPKHQETPETGLVSKHSLYQNQSHHFHFDDPKLEISQIIVAASSHLEGFQVIRYLGVASEHKMLEGHIVEDEGSAEIPRYYSELAQKLKAHAMKAHANAVIGLNYQLTPLPSEYGAAGSKYRLSCTGNLVWVNKL